MFSVLRSGAFRVQPVCQLVEMNAKGGGGFRVLTQSFAHLGENERIAQGSPAMAPCSFAAAGRRRTAVCSDVIVSLGASLRFECEASFVWTLLPSTICVSAGEVRRLTWQLLVRRGCVKANL